MAGVAAKLRLPCTGVDGMLFWTVAMLMALMALMAVLIALLRSGRPGNSNLDSNLGVYRRQLLEIDQELSKNAIGEAEAEQSRLEISRRMLRVSRSGADPGRDDAPRTATLAAAALALLILVPGSIAVYLKVGSQGYPDQPLALRIESARLAYAERPSQNEYLAILPGGTGSGSAEDTPGADSEASRSARDGTTSPDRPEPIASLRSQLDEALDQGDLKRAVSVQRRIIDRLGSNAANEDRLRLAELYVVTAGGRVSPEAEAELVAVLERNPGHPRARYFLGLLALQIGRPDQALATWVDILRETEPDDGLRSIIARDLPVVAELAGFDLRRLGDGIALPAPSTGLPNPVPTAPDAN